jgi:hypothetical protein
VTVNVHHRLADEPLTPAEFAVRPRRRTPPILVAARFLYAVILVAISLWMPAGLRAVSQAMP